MIETALIISLLSLITFGAIQVAMVFAAREVMDHAAFSVARAHMVGFNDFMVEKVGRTALIPNAGKLRMEDVDTSTADALPWGDASAGSLWEAALRARPTSPQAAFELARIPLYLGAHHGGQLGAILDYEDWDTVHTYVNEDAGLMLEGQTRQEFPLRYPFHRAFYADDVIRLRGESRIGNHAALYLQ